MHCGPPPTSVREGKQEGPHSWAVQGNNITPSVTNRFISDGMKYSSQIHLPLYHPCVLAYWCPGLYQFPEAHTVAFCLMLHSSHQPALSNHLADYAFKPHSIVKENFPLYTVNQLMKMEADQVTKFACKKFQHERLMKEKGTYCIWRKCWGEKVRFNLLITRGLFHIQMLLLLRLVDWVWPVDSSCLLSCRGFVTSTITFAPSNYVIGLVTVQCRGRNDKPEQCPSKSTELHANRWQNKVVQ